VAPLLGGTLPRQAISRATRVRHSGPPAAPLSGASPAGTTSDAQRSGAAAQSGYAVTGENVLRRDTGTRSSGTENISVQGEGVTLSVDPRSNSLIFYTTGTRFQTLLPMIKRSTCRRSRSCSRHDPRR